jgi:hypothetical protein
MKHPLLPPNYIDASMHATIISSLAPYERIPDSKDPHFRWDLQKAWQEAQPILKRAHWRYNGGDLEDTADAGWELAANTEQEQKDLHTIVAGVVAHQLENSGSELAIRRVEYRKGGEVALIISNHMQDRLSQMFRQARYEGFGVEAGRAEEGENARRINRQPPEGKKR